MSLLDKLNREDEETATYKEELDDELEERLIALQKIEGFICE